MDKHPVTTTSSTSISLKQWSSSAFAYLLAALFLFGLSRDLAWTEAWWFSVLFLIVGVGGRVLAERNHPGLMAERMHLEGKQDIKAWDKVLAPLMGIAVIYPLVIVAGLDRYYGWTVSFPFWLHALAFVVIVLGYSLSVWSLVENRYFSTFVRIQKERGHEVCDTGPYRFVRHPAYAGNALSSFLIPFFLDSWWVLIPAVIALIITVIRTELEDRTLMNELPGYQDYASHVRYKLFPGVW